jgi:hypothetical protein
MSSSRLVRRRANTGLRVTTNGTSVVVLMLATGLGAMLLPLLIVLFGFSKPRSRRTPVFFFVLLSIILGLVEAVWLNVVTVWSSARTSRDLLLISVCSD